MARCYSRIFNRFSGRIGKVIYYQVGDNLYARRAPGEVKDCRSELQLYYRERMRGTVTFYGVVRQTLLALVWQAVGRRCCMIWCVSVREVWGYPMIFERTGRGIRFA